MSIVIFSVIAVFVVRYADSVMENTLVNGNGTDPNGPIQKQTEEGPGVVPEVKKNDTVTFLLCGTDEMEGVADGMMLVRIHREKTLYTTVYIPSDMRLFVGGADRAIGSLGSLESHQFL